MVSSDKAYQYATSGCAFPKAATGKEIFPRHSGGGRLGEEGGLCSVPKDGQNCIAKEGRVDRASQPSGEGMRMPQENNNGDEYTAFSYG